MNWKSILVAGFARNRMDRPLAVIIRYRYVKSLLLIGRPKHGAFPGYGLTCFLGNSACSPSNDRDSSWD